MSEREKGSVIESVERGRVERIKSCRAIGFTGVVPEREREREKLDRA